MGAPRIIKHQASGFGLTARSLYGFPKAEARHVSIDIQPGMLIYDPIRPEIRTSGSISALARLENFFMNLRVLGDDCFSAPK